MDSQEQLKKDRIMKDFRDSSSRFFEIQEISDGFEHQTNLHFNQGMNSQRAKLDQQSKKLRLLKLTQYTTAELDPARRLSQTHINKEQKWKGVLG